MRLLTLMVVLVVIAFVATMSVYGPVARGRVRRFARRQRLLITPANGNLVIAYLAITRRWRAAGLAAGVAVSIAWSLRDEAVRLNALTLFAGWFVGAIIAEARVVRRSPAERRQASLAPRRVEAYLGGFSRRLLTATLAVSAVSTVATLMLAHRLGRHWLPVLAWFGVALLITVSVRLTQVRVLRRPQPLAEPDIIAADDAIRSRSLHALAGGGAALVLYSVCAQLSALGLSYGDPGYQAMIVTNGLGLFLIPALGWNVATWTWRVRRPEAVALV